ncbi:hypothetical protein L596_020938 [Steinernema carpocapsae]|uniref:Cation-transporting P-type ATPase N-terminal domain-containing protein n=1 Tax=Steinernema carpocapsae TaxID=34508 RepID=A0A4U5MVN0_STECR|nr:hypothetical protein L596_020938 [Steinernema carpocapsae]
MGLITVVRRLCGKDKSKLRRADESSKSLSGLKYEITDFLRRTCDGYNSTHTGVPNSHINCANPKISKGLSKEAAEKRLQQDGPNVLAPPKEINNLMLFLRQFLNMFWILMMGASILSLITYFIDTSVRLNLYVAIVLFLIVLVMCIATFIQEKKAINVVRGFGNLIPQNVPL